MKFKNSTSASYFVKKKKKKRSRSIDDMGLEGIAGEVNKIIRSSFIALALLWGDNENQASWTRSNSRGER